MKAARANRFRPVLETCEERTVPTAVVTVTAGVDAYESGLNGSLSITRSEWVGPLTLSYSWGGTASSTDFFDPLTVSFADGEQTKIIPITAVDDALIEPTETITFILNSGSGYTVGGTGSATINLYDNDEGSPQVPMVVSVAQVADVAEGGASGTFRFTRTGDLAPGLTASYTVSGTATPGADYAALALTVSFAPYQSTVDVAVAAVDDAIVDPNEVVTVTLSPSSQYIIDVASSATMQVIDADSPSVSVAKLADAVEGGASGVIQFTRTGDTSQPLTVLYAVTGTAMVGMDYSFLPGSVTIPAGSTSVDVTFSAQQDGVNEATETVIVTVSPSTNYQTDPNPIVVVNIEDIDTPIVWADSALQTMQEGTTGGITLVRARGDVTQALTVNVGIVTNGLADAAAVWGEDYTLGGSGVGGVTLNVTRFGGTITFAPYVTIFYIPLTVLVHPTIDPLKVFRLQVLPTPVNTPLIYRPGPGPVVSGPGGPDISDIIIVPGGPVSGSIAAIRSDGNGMSKTGWVAENNDNDNYNFNGDPDTSLDQIYDKDELGQVVGENDLVGVVIAPVTNASAGATVSLHFTSPNIRVWANADKSGGQITSDTTTFAANFSHTIFVEGLMLSSAVNAEVITLNYQSGMLGAARVTLDQVAITVYQVKGALNVPGYSRHTYVSTFPGKVAATYGAIVGGTQHSIVPSAPAVAGAATVNALIVNWGEGEVVGTFKVTAPGGFAVNREVNVVKVELDKDAATNSLLLDSDHMAQRPNKRGVISSTDHEQFPAMSAQIEVTRVAGPLVGMMRRGQRFIDLGFMQTVTITSLHGDYSAANNFSMISSLEGKSYIDVAGDNTTPTAQNKPWVWKRYGDIGYRNYRAIATDNAFTASIFDMTDSPDLPAVKNMVEEQAKVNYFSIRLDFVAYFAVHTKETVNAANDSYTIRASAPWTWNGSGVVSATGVWTSAYLIPGFFLPGNPVFSPGGFTKMNESTSGEIVSTDLTRGVVGNDLIPTLTWKRNPPLAP